MRAADVLALAPLLGLGDWDIRVDVGRVLPDHYASLDYREEEKVAQIMVDTYVASRSEAYEARCVAHEMAHLVLRRYEKVAHTAISHLEEPLRTVLAGQLEDELEQAVEALATQMVPAAPRFIPVGTGWRSWGPNGQ